MIGRILLLVPAILFAVVLGMGSARAEEPRRATSEGVRGVVELFTSQGCSSCPPADEILSKLSGDPGIVALSYTVDYWDYIGWVDPNGSRANTDRQRAYGKAFNTGSIYTPQMVVNGQRDVVGSRAAAIESAIAETALTEAKAGVVVGLEVIGERLHIFTGEAEREGASGLTAEAIQRMARQSGAASRTAQEPPSGPSPVLMLITFDERRQTEVLKGENAGRTLVNSHVVRDWRLLGMWDGKALTVDLPIDSLKNAAGGKGGCAAILQSVTKTGAPGPIIAAAMIEF